MENDFTDALRYVDTPRRTGKDWYRQLYDNDLAQIHKAAQQAEQERTQREYERRAGVAREAMERYMTPEQIVRQRADQLPENHRRMIEAVLEKSNKENTMTTNSHNDTLTAIHVKQGTKFCSIVFFSKRDTPDAHALKRHKKDAIDGTYGDTYGSQYTYKHSMDLTLGDIVVLPSGTGIVTALDVAPKFGEGIEYKWVVANITDQVDAMHALQAQEQKAVDSLAVSAAMSEADKVLTAMGVDASKVSGLLGGPQAPMVEQDRFSGDDKEFPST